MAKLSKDEIVTLQTLGQKGQSNRAIARQLNVTEGAVRYHRRRQATGSTDGRKKRSLIETLSLVDEVLAGAILDRLLHCATVLNIQGRSYRLKELDAQVARQTTTATTRFCEPELSVPTVTEPELATRPSPESTATN